MNGIASPTQISNLLTMSICEGKDKRQKVGEPYSTPDEAIRLLRAKVLLEETLETIKAMGVEVMAIGKVCLTYLEPKDLAFTIDMNKPDLEKTIDGFCDVIYVASGGLASHGVPDLPHLEEVCHANLDKFPKGVPIFRHDGKYLKPDGWEPPQHLMVQEAMTRQPSLQEMAAFQYKSFMRKVK